MEKKFNIGQVVYIFSEKKESIVPGIVVEKIMIETLNGNSISWKIKIGPEPNSKIIDSNSFKEIYPSLEEATSILRIRLLEYIKELANSAEEKVRAWYNIEPSESISIKQSDGGTATNLPSSKEDLISKLKALAAADDYENQEIIETEIHEQ